MHQEDYNARSLAVLRRIVETFLDSGQPVGSTTIAKEGLFTLSPASIRNVMAELEDAGLLYSPHTSAGRLPTEQGLRLFVDGLLEMGNLTKEEQQKINAQCKPKGIGPGTVLEDATNILSGLSHCAGVVSVPKQTSALRHIEFVNLGNLRGLAILVFKDGSVENRVIGIPAGLPPSALTKAANYMNARIEGKTLAQANTLIKAELKAEQRELDGLTKQIIAEGLATWSGAEEAPETLIVRGRANLLEDENVAHNLERVRQLFDDLEHKKDLLSLLETAKDGEGVRIFIGAENKLFSLSGSSLIVSPYKNDTGKIVGAIGVIGPTRLNYARIIPLVDYTAQVISRLI